MNTVNKFWIIVILCFVSWAARAEVGKVYEVDFVDGQTIYMYSGVKSTLRIKGVPPDLNAVQLSVVEKPGAPKAYILGKRIQSVNTSAGASSVDYVIEIDNVPFGSNLKQLIELDVKTFKKSTERAYEVVDRIKYFIRPLSCGNEVDEVCALVKSRCRSGNGRCVDDEMKLRSFTNECEMNKYGAEFFHDGACAPSTI